jgi:hypothetical protein
MQTNIEEVHPALEGINRKEVIIDNKSCTLDLFDPEVLSFYKKSLPEKFLESRDIFMKNGRAFIFIYDTTDRMSFDSLSLIRERTLSLRNVEYVPIG